ncbi:hypothetical protein ACFQZ4_22815 [Catellatospora coxensis]
MEWNANRIDAIVTSSSRPIGKTQRVSRRLKNRRRSARTRLMPSPRYARRRHVRAC